MLKYLKINILKYIMRKKWKKKRTRRLKRQRRKNRK